MPPDLLIDALSHRGPDGTGSYVNAQGTVALGHNRLSIIDLSELGNQPMYTEAGDVMVLNGEIYNYQALKKELICKGHGFNSQSDSEVLLKSFVEWGIACLDKIKGMYALALWSARDEKLHLVRDPMGIKPLYYWQDPSGKAVVFASELRAFLGLKSFKASINRNSLNQYLEFGYTFHPSETMFSQVNKVPPGHRLEIKNGVVSKIRQFYFPPRLNNQLLSEGDFEVKLYETLTDVVHQHLIADVSVGLLLSGGLDSSVVASIAAKKEQIHTFSMGFAGSGVDERPHARKVSDFIGSQHQEFLIEPNEILQDLESVMGHYDDIFADWGMISTRILYKKCKEAGMKVVVVGEGADELFGGYDLFRHGLDAASFKPMEWKLFQLYRNYAGRRYGNQYFKFRSRMKQYLKMNQGDLFSAIRLFESRDQLPNNYVMKVDKASMSVSMEARTPFLDSRIADLAYQIPKELLLDQGDEKKILRSMARRFQLLPEEILTRKKFGAGIASNWMEDSDEFRSYAKDIILCEESWVDQLGLRDAMEGYFHRRQTGYQFPRAISIFRNLSWRLLILNLWSRSLNISLKDG